MSYPTLFTTPGVKDFAEAVDAERQAQLRKWGVQHHPDGTGITGDRERADSARHTCQSMARMGQVTWRDIFWEEVAEVFAETEPERLMAELTQVAALAQAWIADIRERCSQPNVCEDGGDPCSKHERQQAHADGEHELCGATCEPQP